MQIERIIITFNIDGSWRGASVTDFNGLPVPLDLEQLAALAPDINTSLIKAIDGLKNADTP